MVHWLRCYYVVNCFQISIFAVANTTSRFCDITKSLLWIAFKLVSLQLQTQHIAHYNVRYFVVNCFQISIFAVANTTIGVSARRETPLWIAFKLVSLQLQTQQCKAGFTLVIVVNCFQISIFAVANTTVQFIECEFIELWIAFKLVSLQLQTQLIFKAPRTCSCCELLSN